MENTSDSFMPGSLLFCMKSKKSVCYSVADNTLDVQKALNAMEKDGIANSAMREALGRLRECMEFAVGNQLIVSNPCLIVEVPWTYKKAKEEIALTQEEQNTLLNEVEDSWYKELFYCKNPEK